MMEDIVLRLSEVQEISGALVALYDGSDRLRYANRAFREVYFIDPGEMPLWADIMRRNFALSRGTIIRAASFEEWLVSTQARRGKVGFRAFETDLFDGRWLWMTETVDTEGWMLCIASDITSIRATERKVRQDRDFALKVAQTDELTGIPNRRFVLARAEEIIARATAVPDNNCGCLAILDLDNFKNINDRFGHAAGDIVLRDFAITIHGMVRRLDSMGRIGGEEFALVLPGACLPDAENIVERMLLQVRQSKPLSIDPAFGYTFSAGIAQARPGDTLDRLYERADKALYRAKLGGRNRICLEGESRNEPAAAI